MRAPLPLDQDTGCVAFDWRPPRVEMRQPNCLLHSVTAALVRKFAFGANRGSGWSYFERRNAIGDEKKKVNQTVTSGEDIFNTCGKGVGALLPPKRGGTVAFMRSLPSRRQPSSARRTTRSSTRRPRGYGSGSAPSRMKTAASRRRTSKGVLVMQTDGVPEDGRLPGTYVAARPAMLPAASTTTATSSDVAVDDKDGWGYRAETGVLQRGARPLCDASAPTKALVNMVNHLREEHTSNWRTYSMRLGVGTTNR